MSIKASDLPLAVQERIGARPRRSKYSAVRTEVDGITFDSRREAVVYSGLKLGMLAGTVLWFCRQPRFIIEGGEYRPDFIAMFSNGIVEIIDAKGFRTPTYKQKKRQMKQRYGIEIKEV